MRTAPILHAVAAAATFLLVPTLWAADAPDSPEELIQKGDVHYGRLEPAEALKYYLPAEKMEPENCRLMVKIARQYRHLMSETSSKEEKVKLGNTAVAYSKRAVALNAGDPEAQLAVAISCGKMLPYQGTKEQLAASKVIKSSVDRVIALDPKNDLGWQVLGRWYLALADVGNIRRALAQVAYEKLPEAKYEDAERCFAKAIELNPKRLMHYIELGRTYAAMGREQEAKRLISKGLAMPATEKDDPETKAMGRELLAKLH